MMASRTGLDPARLTVAVERVFSVLRQGNPPNDISLTAASTIWRLQQEGPRKLTDLAAAEGVSQPAMTQLVQRLEREGMVVRAAEPTDRRVVLIEVTPAGVALLENRRAVRAGHLAALMSDMSADDEALIAAALPALERLARDRR
ncbi:MarR family transcriptional regulator [Dactylosporangium sp. NPDC049140]|jgi:DNA-binding MarR family transcriptional regulator|uniref:MarR family winged helix-turn-helix transcriptional regulator n=1 Tax=Dactylosporangium sp. NPDC049140 TaxID=3155647 RepID=UPI003402FBCA